MSLRAGLPVNNVTPSLPSPQPGVVIGTNVLEEEVVAIARKVGDWQLAHPNLSKEHGPTEWTQGALYTGIMALYRLTGDGKYLEAMMEMGRGNGWKLGARPYFADDHVVGQAYCELYEIGKDRQMIAPMRAQFDAILAQPRTRNLEWPVKGAPRSDYMDWGDRWSWCDALFMGPPAWARLAKVTNDRRYLDFMDREWWVTVGYLYDKQEGLFYRDSRFFAKKTPGGQKTFWSRGNGWVYAGLARVLDYMPEKYPNRERYLQLYKEMTVAITRAQQKDGLWRPSLLDPDEVPRGETSGSAFFCYGLAWGLNRGILNPVEYGPVAKETWRALVSEVHPDGKLGSVQPIGGAPDKVTKDSTEVYGTGAFLLAASEMYRLSQGLTPEEMRRLTSVVVQDWIHAPEHVGNWLEDSGQANPTYPSSFATTHEREIRALMSALRKDGSWADVDYADTTSSKWLAMNHFDRHLEYLVLGYATPGSPLHHDPVLRDKILLAIDYWLAHDYQSSNWWHNMIGIPAYRLGPVLLVMKPELSKKQKIGGADILSRCDLKIAHKRWRGGGNCLYDCRAALFYALFAEDSELAGRIFDRMIYQELHVGASVKEDYSEWEHGNLLYNHGYGAVLGLESARMLWYARAAGIPVNSQGLEFLANYTLEGSQWMTYRNNYLDYSAEGRQIAREVPIDFYNGNYLANAFRYLQWANAPRQADIRDALDRLRGTKAPLEGNRLFHASDYMVQSGTGYFASVRMVSTRTLNTETCNQENILGHHLGEGSTFLVRRGDEYQGVFPVWDWDRVPGTTVNLASRGRLQVGGTGQSAFVGGVSDGRCGVACAEIKTLSLSVRKAWFYFDDGYTCLGAGINDSAPSPVVTTVNQCRSAGAVHWVGKDGQARELPIETMVADTSLPAEARASHRLAGSRLVFHDNIAYLFSEEQMVFCSNQPRRGSWRRINSGLPETPVELPVFTLWLEHGAKPANATYAYSVRPGLDLAGAKSELQSPRTRILANTPDVQAVEDLRSGRVGAVFYSKGALDMGDGRLVSVSAPCVIQWTPESRTLAVGDPSQAARQITIAWAGQSRCVAVAGGRTTLLTIQTN